MSCPIELRESPEGVILSVQVVPGASKERIVGLYGQRLKVAVQAPPEKGKANKALVSVLARALDLKKGQLSIIRGETQRQKDVLVSSITLKDLEAKLAPNLI